MYKVSYNSYSKYLDYISSKLPRACCITHLLDSIDTVSSQSPIQRKFPDTVYLTSGGQDE